MARLRQLRGLGLGYLTLDRPRRRFRPASCSACGWPRN
jgi:hypothetical protein